MLVSECGHGEADELEEALKETIEDKIERERKEYEEAVAKDTASIPDLDKALNMTIKFVDGDTLIADSSQHLGGILGACQAFEQFVAAR